MNIQPLTDHFAVCDQITPDDIATIAAEGYTTIICNRPDHEEPGQPLADDVAGACEAHGITFGYLPFQGIPPEGIHEAFAEQINVSSGAVLAYCRSGQRCSYLFMTVQALITKPG